MTILKNLSTRVLDFKLTGCRDAAQTPCVSFHGPRVATSPNNRRTERWYIHYQILTRYNERHDEQADGSVPVFFENPKVFAKNFVYFSMSS
jgi:hypothetical protein